MSVGSNTTFDQKTANVTASNDCKTPKTTLYTAISAQFPSFNTTRPTKQALQSRKPRKPANIPPETHKKPTEDH
jgi:hypothetical protein